MSFVLTRSDPVINHAPKSPFSIISNASPSPSIPRRPNRPSLRSNKTDSGGVSETIPEADEHQPQLTQPIESSASSSASAGPAPSPSMPSGHNPVSSTAFTHNLTITSSGTHQSVSRSNRGLDFDNLLGPRRTSTSSSLRDDQNKSGIQQPIVSSSASSPESLIPPLVSHSGQIFYASSSTPWAIPSNTDLSCSEPTSNLGSPRPRSSTNSSVPSIPSPVDPLDQHYQFASVSSSVTSHNQFVSPRSNSTPAFTSAVVGSAPSNIVSQSNHQLHTVHTNHQPTSALRPRADSYNQPASWKPWSSGRASSGPLDYLPNRDSVTERKSFLVPFSASQVHQHGSSGDTPPAIIPRSHSLHDLHGTPDPIQLRMAQGLGGIGPINQIAGSTRSSICPNLSLYREPSSHPRPSVEQSTPTLPSFSNELRPSSYPELGSCSNPSDGNFATQATSASRAINRGESLAEEISTIFVVGFPDDMNEREFQNMFMFCSGFEAATLKVPASTLAARERDITAAVVAAAAVAAGNAPVRTANSAGYGTNPPSHRMGQQGGVIVDQFGIPLIGIEGFDDVYQNTIGLESHFINTRPHPLGISGPIVPNCLGAPNFQGIMDIQSGGAATSRKQIIGFAKFKTRADALHARETLSGRKVDAEKGNVLKAEMAKKNLHTKRGLSNEIAVPSLQPASSSAASTVNHSPHVVIESNSAASGPPSARNDTGGEKMSPMSQENYSNSDITLTLTAGTSEFQEQDKGQRPGFDSWNDAASAVAPRERLMHQRRYTLGAPENTYASYSAGGREYGQAHSFKSMNSVEWSETQSPMIEASLGKSLWEKLEEDSEGTVVSTIPGESKPLASKTVIKDDCHSESSGSLSLGNAATSGLASQKLTVGLTAWTGPAPRNHYPADQNPAINTLYVGGLPTVIESVGDVGIAGLMMMPGMMMMRSDDLESGLRKVFGRTEGFKRLSYKVKNQQPMCFVEFDTIEQASTVMEKMYGDKIEGKVPGGIRLAFSRNALGVRSTGSSCSSVTSSNLAHGNLTH
ncbi:expressed protein [Phakopsora pachyrhizi]|uniref:Expressed protein n=1 Tax=Phakopsora pachyrhizi TaxID=170000 RepID=A0AAV0AVB7_PHAPC|nr:expressed protein [Phakopsora pachyrhizi]